MTDEEIKVYCEQKKGSYLDFPFGDGSMCFKVAGHIFAILFILKGIPSLSLKCDPQLGLLLREQYSGIIVRGYHCPPVQQPYNNTIDLTGGIEDAEIIKMIDHSYQTVVRKLTKKERLKFDF